MIWAFGALLENVDTKMAKNGKMTKNFKILAHFWGELAHFWKKLTHRKWLSVPHSPKGAFSIVFDDFLFRGRHTPTLTHIHTPRSIPLFYIAYKINFLYLIVIFVIGSTNNTLL